MAEIGIFKLFVLVMVRVSGFMVAAPVLGSRNFPLVGKAGFTALLALLITPMLPMLSAPLPEEPVAYALMGAGEMLIGLILGFVMSLTFIAIQVGGQIMDMQTGFGMVNVFNPAMETQFPIFGFFLYVLAMLYFLVLNLHHVALRALIHTFDVVPVGGFAVRPAMLWEASSLGQMLFVDGLMVAAPIGSAMLLAYVTMGLLGRVVPQIHLFVVGFPFTIGTGLLLTAMIIGLYLEVVDGMFYRMFREVDTLIRGMG